MTMKLKRIRGYENYFISHNGDVWNDRTGRYINPTPDAHGYIRVNLSKSCIRKTHRIHKLVAIAFISNPNNLPEINHKNGIKEDNNLLNLEWCTHEENQKHGFETGLISNDYKRKIDNAGVKVIRERGVSVKGYAKYFNVSETTIGDIQRGKTYKNV